MRQYRIHRAKTSPALDGQWDSESWSESEIVELRNARPEGSGHFPVTRARLLYGDEHLFGIFHVQDRYVHSVAKRCMEPVCKDSCVELFVKPKPESGYFNFEFNCGGKMLCYYITDPARKEEGFDNFQPFSEDDCSEVKIYHSMPEIVDPEMKAPVDWVIEFRIPFKLIEKYEVGNLRIRVEDF
ncbi:carbohydrate-binding family 9-like protein [Candidatus Hydrogenedentota bacterium]